MKFTYATGSRPLEGFTVKRGIGHGGFGEVYYALSDGGKEVGLKLVQRNLDVELRGVAQCMNLKHPNLITLYDLRTNDAGEQFVIMEYISGKNLAEVLDEHVDGLPAEEAEKWLKGICAGVSYLHDKGIVHRDLKPGNVFIEDGTVKVGDYGLSKFITASRRSGQTESVGTVHYMAPEISRGKYNREIDVYAAGIILYEMLTGNVPFDGESVGEILMKHLTTEPDLSKLPPRYRTVVARALQKDPAARFRSMEELAGVLRGREAVTPEEQATASSLSPGPPQVHRTTGGSENGGQLEPTQARSRDTVITVLSICAITCAAFLWFLVAPQGWHQTHLPGEFRQLVMPRVAFPAVLAGLALAGALIMASKTGVWTRRSWRASDYGLAALCLVAFLWALSARTPGPVVLAALVLGVVALVKRSRASSRRGNVAAPPTGTTVSLNPASASPPARPAVRAVPSPAPRSELERKLIRTRVAELSRAMLLTTVLCTVATVVAYPGLHAPQDSVLVGAVCLAGCWGVLIPAKFWEGRRGDAMLRRVTMASIGLGVGFWAVYLDDLLGVGLFVEEGSVHMPGAGWRQAPLWLHPALSNAGYFGLLFLLLEWWKYADSGRRVRLNPWHVIVACFWAWLLMMVWSYPKEPWGIVIAGMIAALVQLGSPWEDRAARGRVG